MILPLLRNAQEEAEPIRLCLYNLVTDGVPHKLAYRMDFQLAHNIGSVRLGGLDADS